MTLSFAALLALIVEERVSEAAGAVLLWPALAVGAFSLLLWRWIDDLRLYFWVQFFPAFAAILLFSLYPARYTGAYYWIVAMVLYAVAKLFEFTDEVIYSAGGLVSGHTLKHLAAAAACFAILRYFQVRHPAATVGVACRLRNESSQCQHYVDSEDGAREQLDLCEARWQRNARTAPKTCEFIRSSVVFCDEGIRGSSMPILIRAVRPRRLLRMLSMPTTAAPWSAAQPAREAEQDRRRGRQPPALRHLPAG